jgi:hypothetical protein
MAASSEADSNHGLDQKLNYRCSTKGILVESRELYSYPSKSIQQSKIDLESCIVTQKPLS